MKRLKILGILFLAFAFAAGAGLFVMGQIGKSKLADRGGGAIPTLAELEYPELTETENAANLYREAWEELQASAEGTSNASLRLISNYVKSRHARFGDVDDSYDEISESDVEFVGLLLAEAEPAFDLLRKARSTKGCLFLDDHSAEAVDEDMSSFLETGTLMRNLARYVAARALWESEQGDIDAALDWLTTGLHLVNDMSDESVLITEMVRVAMAGIMLTTAQAIVYDHQLPEPIPQALLDELNNLRDRRHYADALRREAALSDALQQAQWQGARWFPLPAMWQGNYLEALGTFIGAVEEEDYSVRIRRLDEVEERIANSITGIGRLFHMWEAILLPALMASDEALENLIAKSDLLSIGLSLRAYEQDNGAFPDTLSELVSEYLAAIPEDPLNGLAYIYDKSGDRVTVRSEAITRRGEIAFHLAPTVEIADSP